MQKRSICWLGASSLNATAGIHSIANPDALTATGMGLLNIAASGAINTLAAEGKISIKAKKKLATCVLLLNMAPIALGAANVVSDDGATSAGLGQMALGVASSMQCLDAIGAFNKKEKEN